MTLLYFVESICSCLFPLIDDRNSGPLGGCKHNKTLMAGQCVRTNDLTLSKGCICPAYLIKEYHAFF